MRFKRSLRVSELIKREIGAIISFTIKDPSIKAVNITSVKVSDDLKYAKIFYSIIGDSQTREEAGKGLDRAKKFIRSEIGHRCDLRYVPEIQFSYDSGMDDAAHIELLLKKIHDSESS